VEEADFGGWRKAAKQTRVLQAMTVYWEKEML
jgi:hypothetical protein